jgi:helicase
MATQSKPKQKPKLLKEFDIPDKILDILEEDGITQTYPPQTEAIPKALAGKNLVLAIPTASGKSLVAYLAILNHVLNGGKALYIVPLRALAAEKYDDLKRFESLGIKVELSMGNLDSPDPRLSEFDIIVSTSEKTDSLLRHRASWLNKISIIVADEIHLINDPSRGPTLELILARFKQVNSKAQLIGLSATIKNSMDMATWLDAEHIQSTWRPVKLSEGVYFEGTINFIDNTKKEILEITDPVTSLVLDTVKNQGQILIFVNSRRSTESLARRLAKHVEKTLIEVDRAKLGEIAGKHKRSELEATTLSAELLKMISSGVAFHHAGLADRHRKLVEKNFKVGLIKCIIATPTLAAGINLPARRVVIRDVSRYNAEIGVNAPIPVLEIKQMMGRAGRPKFDTVGEAVLIAKMPNMVDELRERYILNDSEPIYSKLSIERALRTHILAAIASDFVKNTRELEEYIGNTFYAHQSEYYTLSNQIERVLDFLSENDLIVVEDGTENGDNNGVFIPTEFGRRTSSLYLDPESAVLLRRAVENANEPNIPPLIYLHAICSTPDMLTFYLRRTDYHWLENIVEEYDKKFIHKWYETKLGYDDFLSQLKTACMLEDWIEERAEEFIEKKYNIGPGDIRNKVETGRWLLYSMRELARMFNTEQQRPLNKLTFRIEYGVSDELLDLVSLRGIGRVRARSLFKHGYKSLNDLRAVEEAMLARIPSIGPGLAKKIISQL